jgi:hypothetical protein
MKLCDWIEGGFMKRFENILESTNIPFSIASYMRMSVIWNRSKQRFKVKDENDGTATTIEEFFRRFKKGSKKIRKILTFPEKKNEICNLNTVKTFIRLTTVTLPRGSNKIFETVHSLWNNYGLENAAREFCFKF